MVSLSHRYSLARVNDHDASFRLPSFPSGGGSDGSVEKPSGTHLLLAVLIEMLPKVPYDIIRLIAHYSAARAWVILGNAMTFPNHQIYNRWG
jgi:hypothetical protein